MIFFSVMSIFISPNEHKKQHMCIFRSGIAMSKNTTMGIHDMSVDNR